MCIYFLELSIIFWNCSEGVVIFRFSFFSVTFFHPYIPWWTFWNAKDQCLSWLKLWVLIPFMASCTRYTIMWFSLSVTCDRVDQLLLTLFSNFVLKGLVLLILFYVLYDLLPMTIVVFSSFLFSLLYLMSFFELRFLIKGTRYTIMW